MVAGQVLILGGTAEARQLANQLVQQGIAVTTSLAGRTAQPLPVAGRQRFGGFGGTEGLTAYLQETDFSVVVDATHPFAAAISQQAAIATQQTRIPRLMLVRPAWEAVTGDRWIRCPSIASAVNVLPQVAERVFLTIGRQEIQPFVSLTSLWYLMRFWDLPEAGTCLPPGDVVRDRPPFTLAQEKDYLTRYTLDTLVTKNSGGTTTYAKIQAARELGCQVLMIDRPALPSGTQVATIEAAAAWVNAHL